MFITFGTRFYGKVATVNNQWVETKFFSIMFLPVFPIGSIYVTSSGFNKRKGFDIALHKKSIIATYCRLFTFLLAAWMFFYAYEAFEYGMYSFSSSPDEIKAIIHAIHLRIFTYTALGLLFIGTWVYFCFYFGKATPADINTRNKVASVTGMYALPHWFSYPELRNMLKSFQLEYKQQFPENDWIADLGAPNVSTYKLPLLFAIALFNCMVFDLPAALNTIGTTDDTPAPTSRKPAMAV